LPETFKRKDRNYYEKYKHEIAMKRKLNYDPLKNGAQSRLRYAVKMGEIIRRSCEVCGKDKVEAHHEDYTKPLDVIWLCPMHHKRLHAGDKLSLPSAPKESGDVA
jgi:hypothetical protein